jgi:predicted nucleic acid-binding protein
MKIAVDSNIVFSAILNSQSKIGQLIITGSKFFQFYSIGLLKEEIELHKDKILTISGFTEQQYQKAYQKITNRIVFIDDILIPDEIIQNAIDMVSDIDKKDILFVALTNHLNARLWTGDRKLISGLMNKGYIRTMPTEELYEIFLEKQLGSVRKQR